MSPDTAGPTSAAHRWSPTSAALYERCPRAWWLRYRAGLRPGDTPVHWRRGSVMHAGLEGLFAPFALGVLRPAVGLRAALPVARRAVARAWAEYDMPDDEPMRREVLDWIEAVAGALTAPTPAAVLGLEVEITTTLPGGAVLRGILDQLLAPAPGWLHVRDWKSYYRPPADADLRKDLQQGSYAVLAAAAHPIVRGRPLERLTVEVFCPPTLRSTVVEMTPKLRRHHLEQLEHITGQADADATFTPKPSEWCRPCAVRMLCPIYGNGAAVDPRAGGGQLAGVRDALELVDEF